MTTYRILEPEDWGMRWAKPPIAERLLDPEQYIHHRAGNARHLIPAEQAFYEMNEGAIINDGMSATDYDILVHEHTPSDTVSIGIARGPWLSAATRDRNEQGEAVCALGYFHPGHSLSERPSPGMLEGIARACVISRQRGWTAPDAVILGHRQNPAHPGATSCPGDYLFAELDTIRRRVADLLNPPTENDMPTWDDRRLLDTREPGIGQGPVKAGTSRSIDIGHPTAKQAIVNITMTAPTAGCYVTASGTGTSKVNDNPTLHTVANECTVPVADGRINLTVHKADCHLVVDLVGVYP